ncbi:MAG: GNAT family N-acetyltransferase [Planctomycetota bacterium]
MTANPQGHEAIVIRRADWSHAADVAAVVQMIDDYASDAMGGGQRLPAQVRDALPAGLRDTPGSVAFLVEDGGQAVGVAVCFTAFSTFAGKPKLNIHDFSINPSHRRRGLGQALMQRVLDYADDMGCGKVTLEVRSDNEAAQRLYRAAGFGPSDPPYEFWTRTDGNPAS